MKKSLVIFLLIAYTAAASGVTLNYHYCAGRLDHVSLLNFGKKGACSCDLDTMPKNCCTNNTVYHKIDNHKNFSESYSFNKIAFFHQLPPATDYQDYNLRSVSGDSNYNNYHVRHSRSLAIYLSIRSLRI